MKTIGVFAALEVGDMAAAEAWYTRLLGRAPDHRPMEGLVQWVSDAGGIQLFGASTRTGTGGERMTIVTPDLDDARRELAARGLDLEPDIAGDFGRIAQIADPEGNRITLAEPPRQHAAI